MAEVGEEMLDLFDAKEPDDAAGAISVGDGEGPHG
jgi:hypothetical protein